MLLFIFDCSNDLSVRGDDVWIVEIFVFQVCDDGMGFVRAVMGDQPTG